MEKSNAKLIQEIKKLTEQLELQNRPFKRIRTAFVSGIFTALGYLFGTVVVGALIIYIFSRLSFTKNIIDLFK